MSETPEQKLKKAAAAEPVDEKTSPSPSAITSYPIVRNETLTKTFASLIGNANLSDVTFLVENKNIAGHRFLLAIRSSVFYAMFYGAAKTDEEVIVIDDIRFDVFETVLLYIYTDEIFIDQGNVVEIMLMAHKYDLGYLEEKCQTFIAGEKDPKSALGFFDRLYPFDAFLPLKKSLLKYICDNFDRKFNSADCLLMISRLDTLDYLVEKLVHIELNDSGCLQCDLYEMLINWAKVECNRTNMVANACNIRSVLGGIEDHFNMTKMSPEVFNKLIEICPTYFSNEEINSAFEIIRKPGASSCRQRKCQNCSIFVEAKCCKRCGRSV